MEDSAAPKAEAETELQSVHDADGAAAEATEKALIEEAKKAGGAAYQFDPASSTEQKDRQVKSVATFFPFFPLCDRHLFVVCSAFGSC